MKRGVKGVRWRRDGIRAGLGVAEEEEGSGWRRGEGGIRREGGIRLVRGDVGGGKEMRDEEGLSEGGG